MRDEVLTLDNMYRGDHGDHRFPRSDISLKEAGHRVRLFHILEDLEEDDFLLIRKGKGEIRNERFDEVRIEWGGWCQSLRIRHHRILLFHTDHLEVKEFLISELGSCSVKIFDTLWEMNIANIRRTW